MRLFLALLLAAPAVAQSSVDTPVAVPTAEPARLGAEAAAVDSALVGAWTLDAVTRPGVLAAFGVDVQAMTATFSADGEARIVMTAVQDGEAMFRDRAFLFVTDGGQILEENAEPLVYIFLDDGALELIDGDMVVRFVRAAL